MPSAERDTPPHSSLPRHRGRQTSGAERRRAERRTVLDSAAAFQNAPLRRFNCVVRDISDTGARLIGADIDIIQARFVLAIRDDGQEPRICQVVWRRNRMIGVRFIPRRAATATDAAAMTAALAGRSLISDAAQVDAATMIAVTRAVTTRMAEEHAKTPRKHAHLKPLRGMS